MLHALDSRRRLPARQGPSQRLLTFRAGGTFSFSPRACSYNPNARVNSTAAPASNPLREGLSSRPMPQPCNIVIFGASGDLTYRKLIPALYNLSADGDLPAALSIVGFARREKTDEQFRQELGEALKKFSRQGLNDEIWQNFGPRIFYHRGEFGNLEAYKTLKERLDKLDAERGTRGNRLYYLSVSPNDFECILEQIK